MIALRPATPQDAIVIASIHMDARRVAMPYLPELHSDQETEAWIRDIVLPHQDVWLAMVHDDVAGYIAIDGTCIEALYVRPVCQGQGVGGVLLRHAKDRSAGALALWTFQRNIRARRFYEARGFCAVEFTDGAGNEEHEPDVRYAWVSPASSGG